MKIRRTAIFCTITFCRIIAFSIPGVASAQSYVPPRPLSVDLSTFNSKFAEPSK
jgi:hypothetical protein